MSRRASPRRLLRGVDSLYLVLQGDELMPDMPELLAEALSRARRERTAVPVQGMVWVDVDRRLVPGMRPYGHTGFEYAVYTDCWEVSIGRPGGNRWTAYAQIRSQYLWRVGLREAATSVERVMRQLVASGDRVTVSRADLAQDLVGWELLQSDKLRFTTPARSRRDWPNRLPRPDAGQWDAPESYWAAFDRGRELATLYFGSGGADHQSRLYRKDWQCVGRPGMSWYLDMAKRAGYDGEEPLLRVEHQMRGAHLRRFEVHTVADLEACLGDLWSASCGWLQFRQASGANLVRQRSVVGWWSDLRDSWRDQDSGVLPVRASPKPEVGHLLDQAAGLLTSWAALQDRLPDGEEAELFLRQLLGRLDDRGRDFYQEVQTKRTRFGRTVLPDSSPVVVVDQPVPEGPVRPRPTPDEFLRGLVRRLDQEARNDENRPGGGGSVDGTDI